MDLKNIFDTDYIEINNKRFCPYCGKEIESKTVWDSYDRITYWKCECEDALEAHKIKAQMESLKYKLPKQKYKMTQTITKI